MLRSAVAGAGGALDLAIKQLIQEDSLFDQNERRSIHREVLVRPIEIVNIQSGDVFEGFTRNVSSIGVSLITKQPQQSSSYAKLRIESLQSGHALFLAECRWCIPFGGKWFMSGWNFVNVDPSRLC
jgi:hypothetical protein